MRAGSIPESIKVISDIENTFSAAIPNKPNIVIKTASLVPSPLIVIGINPINVAIGNIAKK